MLSGNIGMLFLPDGCSLLTMQYACQPAMLHNAVAIGQNPFACLFASTVQHRTCVIQSLLVLSYTIEALEGCYIASIPGCMLDIAEANRHAAPGERLRRPRG